MITRNKKRSGFTVIEAVVLIGIFAVSVLAFYRIFTLASFHIIESKKRLAAIALSNERMEHIRNIVYTDIGISGGSPQGLISADETVVVNGTTYRILVDVRYIDDTADGTISNSDTLPDDYKRVQIYTLWGAGVNASVSIADAKGDVYKSQRVDITSQFVPPGGLESATGNGIISINVLDSDGQPVTNASVRIFHDDSPSIDYTAVTDATGNLLFSTPPASAYEITVSKSNYETIKSEAPYNGSTQLYEPINTHQIVLEGQLTTMTVISDIVSDFEINVRDPFCQPISPGVAFDFDITGGRVVGTDPNDDGAPIYVLDTALTTDTSGDIEVYTDTDADGTIETSGDDEASAGLYKLTLNEPGYTLWKVDPGDDVDRSATIASSGSSACNFIVIEDVYDSALIEITDTSSGDSVPVLEAVVRLQNTLAGYDVSQETDKYGMVFFPENANVPLVNGTEYDLRVSADGYYDKNVTVTIDGLETPVVDLTPEP